MVKYQYWTYITQVGKHFKNRLKVGELISSPYKKESFEMFNNKEGRVDFMCSGDYVGRVEKDLPLKERIKILNKLVKNVRG